MTDVMQAQVGGDHYAKMGMQPFEFGMANRYDPLAFTVLKYVARHASKAGAVDLRKAQHCAQMRVLLWDGQECRDVISIHKFLSSNRMAEREGLILLTVHRWALGSQFPSFLSQQDFADNICQMIERLISHAYPEEKSNV